MLSALDILSQGRVIFGAGSGVDWDFTPFGEPGDARIRAEMLDEGLDLLVKLLSGAQITHHGRYYTAREARLVPSPVQQPRIPVWIGGDRKAALRRAALWDGWIIGTVNENSEITKTPVQVAEQVEYIRQHRSGSAPFDVAVDGVSEPGSSSLAREYADAGATWWFECIFGFRGTPEEMVQRVAAGPPG